jgi:NDP-4-keto-2,6-dideoxyhexose 3-C-methyltransferase
MYKTIKACRICGNVNLITVMSLGNLALTGTFPRSKNEAVTSGPLDVVKCDESEGCGLVQLLQSYSLQEMYGMNYGYRSGLNASMIAHLHSKVAKILSLGVLKNGDIVIDIGSNDSTTLSAYPVDQYELVGIDPTGVKFQTFYPKHINLVPDFFCTATVEKVLNGRQAKIITSFSMFYDLEDPVSFAQDIAKALHPDGVWILEQSYLPTMLRTNSFDTICHEHLEFYALKQIIWICEKADLKVLDVEFNQVNGGSFSVSVARAASAHVPNDLNIKRVLAEEAALGLSSSTAFDQFKVRLEQARVELVNFLNQTKRDGKKVHGLGASTKGNVLLQYFGIGPELLSSIGEVNTDKIGRYTPGSLIPIVSEEDVLLSKPDFLVVLPWHFKDFFINSKKLEAQTLVFPLPELEIVQAQGTSRNEHGKD